MSSAAMELIVKIIVVFIGSSVSLYFFSYLISAAFFHAKEDHFNRIHKLFSTNHEEEE